MEMTAKIKVQAVSLTDAVRPFFLSYQLKGVCKSNFYGRHEHRRLFSREHGLLAVWKVQFYVTELLPVLEVDEAFLRNTTLILSRHRIRGVVSNTSMYPTPWIPLDTVSLDTSMAPPSQETTGQENLWDGFRLPKSSITLVTSAARTKNNFVCVPDYFNMSVGMVVWGI